MPTVLPAGLAIAAVLEREDARDVFISRKAGTLRELASGAVIGTASLRRQAMVLRLRADLAVVPMRGNVETRLRKLDAGEVDATLLALAGLKRLGLADAATAVLSVEEFLPAVGQGVIAIEARADDARHVRCSRRSIMPRPRRRWRPSARSSPCSTAPAARRSPVMPPSRTAAWRSAA